MGRTPTSSMQTLGERIGECPVRARSTARADGLDASRALQRVLYRSAKQQPDRRFHALYDKVARSDILWRAWDEVRANRGAPGVDGVTIDAVEASGVAAFLEQLATELRVGTYRPKPLRRVDIPKPGQPGRTRPLQIPCVRDRVAMTAAKLVLEPIFEADFLPSSYGFRPKRSAHQACDAVRVEANRGREWVLDADVRDCLGVASHCPSLLGKASNRPPSAWATSIRRPFRLPVRTWTARSSPRLTRCNTVCRETPSAMVASSIGSHPSGACSTNRPRSWSVTRIRQGAPGVGCSPAMNPSASHRCTVEGATPSSSAALAMVASSPSGGVVGGW